MSETAGQQSAEQANQEFPDVPTPRPLREILREAGLWDPKRIELEWSEASKAERAKDGAARQAFHRQQLDHQQKVLSFIERQTTATERIAKALEGIEDALTHRK